MVDNLLNRAKFALSIKAPDILVDPKLLKDICEDWLKQHGKTKETTRRRIR